MRHHTGIWKVTIVNKATKYSLIYGSVALVVGTFLEPIFAGQIFFGSGNQGALVSIAIALRWPLISIGAAAVGAGIVIHALSGENHREHE